MRKLSGKSLLLAASLFWIAPASAKQEPASPRQQAQDLSACPENYERLGRERTEAAKSGNARTVILIPRSDTLGVAPVLDSRRAAFLP